MRRGQSAGRDRCFSRASEAYAGRVLSNVLTAPHYSTGLHYYRARYYHPGLQRFISEDPIGFGGGPNLYAYVLNSPTTRVDPSGLLIPPNPVGAVGGGVSGFLGGYYVSEQAGGGLARNFTFGVIGATAGALVGGYTPTIQNPFGAVFAVFVYNAWANLNAQAFTSVVTGGRINLYAALGAGVGAAGGNIFGRGLTGMARFFAQDLRGIESITEGLGSAVGEGLFAGHAAQAASSEGLGPSDLSGRK